MFGKRQKKFNFRDDEKLTYEVKEIEIPVRECRQ